MCAAIGIPTTRVSNLFVRQRLIAQVTSDEVALFKVQQQLATGYRIQAASEDSQAASRIVSYKQLLTRMSQLEVNITNTQSYLSSVDSALGTASDLISSTRAEVLGVMGTTATDEERAAAAQQVLAAISELVNLANGSYGDRQLFSGSLSGTLPYAITASGAVIYSGNEKSTQTYVDLNLLFNSNVTGQEAFGGLSSEVCSEVDMTPIVTASTRLSELNNGAGVNLGTIVIADGKGHTSSIDLSGTSTVGDVAAMIHNCSVGVDVEITTTGLKIALQDGTGTLTIADSGEGTTAKDLGILATNAGPTVTGTALNPQLTKTTAIDNIAAFGTRATACLHFGGYDNDLVFSAAAIGDALNGVNIVVENSATVTGGHEIVTWDGTTLTIQIAEGESTAANVVAAVQAQYEAGTIPITCVLDPVDLRAGGSNYVGTGTTTLAGGSGEGFDRDSGMQIVNGGTTTTLAFSDVVTVEDLLNRLNLSDAGVLAEINADSTSINIRSRISGDDFAIGENGGSTATELGVRTFTGATRLDALNYGAGIYNDQPNGSKSDFTITCTDSTGTSTVTFSIDTDNCKTIQDVITLINTDATNAGRVQAQLATDGNGIELVDTAGAGSITVTRENLSFAAYGLGLLAEGETSHTVTSTTGNTTYTGTDTNPLETDSVFTALVRILRALETNDQPELNRAVTMLDTAAEQITFVRAEVGVRQNSLSNILTREQNQVLEIKSNLSIDYDTDYAEAASEFSGRQIAYQASLQAAAAIFQMTLLDYI
jgi:flagellin-like hook-associated protein FlgL